MNSINQFVTNNLILLLISSLGVILVLFVWNLFLEIRLRKQRSRLDMPKDKQSLEQIVLEHGKNLKLLDKDIQELYTISNQINALSLRGIHKVGMVRFNPFKDVGGDQSFAIALLNGKSNGLVISSLYTREGTRVYAKSILSGKAEKYPLTEEEEQAIKIAISKEAKNL